MATTYFHIHTGDGQIRIICGWFLRSSPPGMLAQVALTMTDEYPYAYAQVIISAVP